MTRIAIVARDDELRAALAAALDASEDFDVVGVAESAAEILEAADVTLVAQGASQTSRGSMRDDRAHGAMLTKREREILSLLADGLGNKHIAARLGISANTVKTHLELLFEKLDVSTRAEAVASAVRQGLLLL